MLDFFSTTFHVFSLCVSLLFCLSVCVCLSLALSLSLSLCFCCPSVPASVPFPVCSFTHKLIYNLVMPNKRSLCVFISPCYLPLPPTHPPPHPAKKKEEEKKKPRTCWSSFDHSEPALNKTRTYSTWQDKAAQTKLGHTELCRTSAQTKLGQKALYRTSYWKPAPSH